LTICIEAFDNGALFAKRDRNFYGLILNNTPDVKFFFQEKLFFDDQFLLYDGKDCHIVFGADVGNVFDTPVDRNARDLNGFARQGFPHDLVNGIEFGANADLA